MKFQTNLPALCLGALGFCLMAPAGLIAQQATTPATPPAAAARRGGGGRGPAAPVHVSDNREGLKAGLYDAGEASENMELIETLHQPEGMASPGGIGTGGLNYANSDMAFGKDGKLLVQGNFHGMLLFDISNPAQTKLESIITCPGGQGDVSIWNNLLFMSVESYGRIDCGPEPSPFAAARGGRGRGAAPEPPAPNGAPGAVNVAAPGAGRAQGARPQAPPDPNRMYGVRIFDITDPMKPKQVAAVQTCRGSHTHTIVTSPKDKDNIYLYVSGGAGIRSSEEMAGCIADPAAPHTSAFGIDVIKVPLAHPEQSKVVSHAYVFADANTGAIAGLHGRTQGSGEPIARPTDSCHDITAYPYIGLAGGACSGNGLLLDISDPVHPVRLDDMADPAFSFWHSATFNNDGTKVLFSDEWGGGQQPKCRADDGTGKPDPANWGGDAIFDIVGTGTGRHLKFEGYYKMPAYQTAEENCVAHNGGLIPVPGRDLMSQAFYQGGATVFDFTDAAHAKEIAYFDRGPIDATKLVTGGYWSIYYYNGYLYGSEIARGLDVFQLKPSEYLSQNELDAAKLAHFDDLNYQDQPHVTWPAVYVVARAYLDQLNRDQALPADRIAALNAAMTKIDGMQAGSERKAAVAQLDAMAVQLQKDAAPIAESKPVDAKRMRDCATTLLERDKQLR